MAREAIQQFPSMMKTIRELNFVLRKLPHKPDFDMLELLLDESNTTAHMINEAHVSQPLCTAIQIALVDLLDSWGIQPRVSVGHSSGEIAAAYGAGLLSAPEAIVAAYYRGYAVRARSGTGSMLAVALGPEEVQKYIAAYDPAEICVACENSPSSVTLSGHPKVVARVGQAISVDGVFARELKIGRAYPSPHMNLVGDYYDVILREGMGFLGKEDLI